MVLEKRFFRDLNDDIRAAVEENLKYKAMSSDIYDKLIEEMRRAWEELDADIIEPYLSEDLHYYRWTMVDFYSKASFWLTSWNVSAPIQKMANFFSLS